MADEDIVNAISAARCPVGLVENTSGKPFQCGTCRFMVGNGTCNNPHPKLKGRHVEPKWCCNLYKHDGMRTIVK